MNELADLLERKPNLGSVPAWAGGDLPVDHEEKPGPFLKLLSESTDPRVLGLAVKRIAGFGDPELRASVVPFLDNDAESALLPTRVVHQQMPHENIPDTIGWRRTRLSELALEAVGQMVGRRFREVGEARSWLERNPDLAASFDFQEDRVTEESLSVLLKDQPELAVRIMIVSDRLKKDLDAVRGVFPPARLLAVLSGDLTFPEFEKAYRKNRFLAWISEHAADLLGPERERVLHLYEADPENSLFAIAAADLHPDRSLDILKTVPASESVMRRLSERHLSEAFPLLLDYFFDQQEYQGGFLGRLGKAELRGMVADERFRSVENRMVEIDGWGNLIHAYVASARSLGVDAPENLDDHFAPRRKDGFQLQEEVEKAKQKRAETVRAIREAVLADPPSIS